MNRARDLPRRSVRPALRLESASSAFVLKRPVEHHRFVIDERSNRAQRSAAGTAVDIVLVVVGEVAA